MPLLLSLDRDETRATTNRVVAAIEGLIGRLLSGPRQHAIDRYWSLAGSHPASRSESTGEGGAQC